MENAARYRPYHSTTDKYRLKTGCSLSIYEKAKSAETEQRDLTKALIMYT